MQIIVETINRFTPGLKLVAIAFLGLVALFKGLAPAIRTMKSVGSGDWAGAGKDIVATICVFIIPVIFIGLITYAMTVGNDISGLLK